jgi:ribose 5-phosphate isomerase B
MPERVAIANDHAGVALKQALLSEIAAAGFEVLNLGTDDAAVAVDYPDFGQALAEKIAAGAAKFGIAICGSGIGISIAANRVAGVRAALCHSGREAELARQHNDANILALGARVIGVEEAKECVRRFLATAFEGGRHAARVKKLG